MMCLSPHTTYASVTSASNSRVTMDPFSRSPVNISISAGFCENAPSWTLLHLCRQRLHTTEM
ncbi:hypothetical protein E2C01_094690 [Portunus trituberculatus]|uniref:Uncharacterized protein n=1 Tax=Portunus trituberculatus TaxID=210409 RepID=A0A5B7JXJ4_PORTR|nr:hypothetical protein [Portunus trituberculatus]